MKKNIMEYKGYHTCVEFDAETCVLRGKIEGISDFVDFESSDPQKIDEEFHAAVDDYLTFCKTVGKDPDKEYKGTFNVRIAPVLHKKLAIMALREGESLNTTVERAIHAYVENDSTTTASLQQQVRILTYALAISEKDKMVTVENFVPETKIIPFHSPKIKMQYNEARSN